MITAASMVILLSIGLGVGWAFRATMLPTSTGAISTTQVAGSTNSSEPFQLTLVEIMQNMWNSSGMMQPEFFVLGDRGLESSANISLPVNRLIHLTIISYDTPTPGSTDAQGVVSGTVGGNVYVINGTVAAGTADPTEDMAGAANQWGQNMTSVPGSMLAHTFTIQALGINIPVIGGDTVMAYIIIHHPGHYSWLCLTPCGFGGDGMAGAMSRDGWMSGQITAG